jgi:hypothetical protein
MKRLVLIFMIVTLWLAVPALAVPSWRTNPPGQPPTTYQKWTFDDDDYIDVVPEIYANVYGTPTANISASGIVHTDPAGWYDEYLGRYGVWHGDITGITLYIPNTPNPYVKELWVEVGCRGNLISYDILDPQVGVTDLGYTMESVGKGWQKLTFGFQIVPNPVFEVINFVLHDSGADVDYIIVDTICTPEPATIALFGLGVLSLLRRRK